MQRPDRRGGHHQTAGRFCAGDAISSKHRFCHGKIVNGEDDACAVQSSGSKK